MWNSIILLKLYICGVKCNLLFELVELLEPKIMCNAQQSYKQRYLSEALI